MEVQLDDVVRDKLVTAIEAPPPPMTPRDIRLPPIASKAFTIIGMRRSGKTTYLHQCRAERLRVGQPAERLVYFNFEDERLGDVQSGQLARIVELHGRLYPQPDGAVVTFFFDEIQRVAGWEVFVRRLLDTTGYDVFLSGSSAKLLSREIATAMRGRAWEITLYPFSFGEYLRHHGLEVPTRLDRVTRRRALGWDQQVERYLDQGGFPEAQTLDLTQRRQLLQGYVDVVLLRDVIERHGIANSIALRWLVRRLLGNPAGLFSITRLFNDLRGQGIAVGRETLYALLDHLEDAFLLHTLPLATESEKRRQVNPRKVYPADSGLIPVFDRSGRANTGHALETAVCIELLRHGCELAYVQTRSGYEVDFLARWPDGRQTLIQVSASVHDPDTLAREVRALREASLEYHRAELELVVLDSLSLPPVPPPIRVVPAWRWFLESRVTSWK
jgi:hypothetical protein